MLAPSSLCWCGLSFFLLALAMLGATVLIVQSRCRTGASASKATLNEPPCIAQHSEVWPVESRYGWLHGVCLRRPATQFVVHVYQCTHSSFIPQTVSMNAQV